MPRRHTGVNWDVQLMSLRAGDAEGSLEIGDIIEAFAYACAEGARVVNGSFGASGISQTMYNAIVSPGCTNTLFVFAAGNDGANNDVVPQYPCNYHLPGAYGPGAPNVVCVAATNDLDELADFSNHGAASVHLAAPGVDILDTWPAYQTIFAPDGFDDPVESIFDARWSGKTSTAVVRSGAVPPFEGFRYAWSDRLSVGRLRGRLHDDDSLVPPAWLDFRVGCRVSYDILLDTEALPTGFSLSRNDTGDLQLQAAGRGLRTGCSSRCPPISL